MRALVPRCAGARVMPAAGGAAGVAVPARCTETRFTASRSIGIASACASRLLSTDGRASNRSRSSPALPGLRSAAGSPRAAAAGPVRP